MGHEDKIRRWTKAEKKIVHEMYEAGASYESISLKVKRTRGSVKSLIYRKFPPRNINWAKMDDLARLARNDEIIALHKSGMESEAIADRYEMHPSSIYKIIKGGLKAPTAPSKTDWTGVKFEDAVVREKRGYMPRRPVSMSAASTLADA